MAMFDKSPEWGTRFQIPANQQIDFNGDCLRVTDNIYVQMVEDYEKAVTAEISKAACEAGASDVTLLNKAAIVDALLKRNPRRPVRTHEVYPRHDWIRDEKTGKIDLWAASTGHHNGPMCQRCWETKCVHCDPDWNKDEECVVDRTCCPACNSPIHTSVKYCSQCGQAIDWKEEPK